MSALDLLAATGHVERAGALLAAVGCIALVIRAVRRARAPVGVLPGDALEAALGPWREAACLSVILLVALLTRTVGWSLPLTAPHWFSEMPAVFIADAVERGAPWHEWLLLLRNFQGYQPQHSAIFMPVAAVFQRLVGPVLHLPVLIGAFWGVAGVVCAWLAGRAMIGRLFGLVFAALLAASPLNLVWSRIGGVPITAVPGVLLVMWLARRGGVRQSIVSTVASGVAAWATIYLYYPARVAMPLALVVLWQGLRDGGARRARGVVLVACLVAVLAGFYAWASITAEGRVLWPGYPGYTGNRGERTLAEVVRASIEPVQREGARALQVYFDRARRDPADGPGWGATFGGLVLAPVGVLGLLGLLVALRHPIRYLPWLLLTAGGLAAPVLSLPSARRFLVFDAGWCALAALGTVTMLRSRLLAGLGPLRVGAAVVVGLVTLTAWSFATVVLLNVTLSDAAGTPIPFGESAGLGDGRVCRRCVAAGHEWMQAVAGGAFVILVDSDATRENRTIPGGLPLYGKLAALAAGRPRNFADLYTVWHNVDVEPPRPAVPLRPGNVDFATYLVGELERTAADAILWHFEDPTAWEQWLATRLVAAGGTLRTFRTPLGPGAGIEIRTPWSERAAVFALLHELAAPEKRDDAAQVSLLPRETLRYPFPPLVLAGLAPAEAAGRPEWLAGGGEEARFGADAIAIQRPAGAAVTRGQDGRSVAELLDGGGMRVTHQVAAGEPDRRGRVVPPPVGLSCAAFVDGAWWVVDPVRGALMVEGEHAWVPAGRWIGVAAGPGTEIVLASADQQLVVLDAAGHRELQRFPAPTWPSRRLDAGECAPLAAGDAWYATFNHLTSVVTFYARDGRLLGSRNLERLLRLGNHRIMSVAGVGRWLAAGVWYDNVARVLEVAFAPGVPGERLDRLSPDVPQGEVPRPAER